MFLIWWKQPTAASHQQHKFILFFSLRMGRKDEFDLLRLMRQWAAPTKSSTIINHQFMKWNWFDWLIDWLISFGEWGSAARHQKLNLFHEINWVCWLAWCCCCWACCAHSHSAAPSNKNKIILFFFVGLLNWMARFTSSLQ